MRYIEISLEEAITKCNKNAMVLVAEQDLEKNCDYDIVFKTKEKSEYDKLFQNIQTAASLSNDLVKQLSLFTEKQDVFNIRPRGVRKIVLLADE